MLQIQLLKYSCLRSLIQELIAATRAATPVIRSDMTAINIYTYLAATLRLLAGVLRGILSCRDKTLSVMRHDGSDPSGLFGRYHHNLSAREQEVLRSARQITLTTPQRGEDNWGARQSNIPPCCDSAERANRRRRLVKWPVNSTWQPESPVWCRIIFCWEACQPCIRCSQSVSFSFCW